MENVVENSVQEVGSGKVSDDERRAVLAERIAHYASRGYRVESMQGDLFQAIMVRGSKPNHVLHLILTLVTLGLWGIVWIALSATSGEERGLVLVDEYGVASSQRFSR